MINALQRILAGVLPIMLASCFMPRPAEVPVPVKFFAGEASESDELVVFLPGRGDDIDAYHRSGFIDALHQSYWPVDAVVVDAHLGYYIDRSLSERLYEDVLVPYRQRGYRRFLIVGVSLGGVGALRLREDYPGIISGVVLIAPYLGEEATIQAVSEAKSLEIWQQRLDGREALEPGEEIWSWIAAQYNPNTKTIPCMVLAFGSNDRFSAAAGVLSQYLPASQVFTNGGEHNWPSWHKLWVDILAAERLPGANCAAGRSGNYDENKTTSQRRVGS